MTKFGLELAKISQLAAQSHPWPKLMVDASEWVLTLHDLKNTCTVGRPFIQRLETLDQKDHGH